MQSIKLSIPNATGFLHAKLEKPTSGKVKQLAIFAHCFTCTSNLGIAKHISKTLTQNGIAVLRFDFAGLGKSDGEFAETNFTHNVEDLITVFTYLKANYKTPDVLIGHSLGGAAVIAAAEQLTEVKAIVTIGAPSSPAHVKHLFADKLDEIKQNGQAKVHVGGRPFILKEQFLEDIKDRDFKQIIHSLKKPLLIMHSPQDEIVEIANAAEIYNAAFHPKSFISLDGADHILTNKLDAIYAANVIASWVDRYISFEEVQEDMELQEKEVLTHLNFANGFTANIYTQNHQILADEPTDIGGEDLGFAPYDLLNASLGACTAMTLKMYAELKKWNLEEVFVRISNEKRDLTLPNGEIKKVEVFHKNIKFVGNLEEEQKAKLLAISSKCPVHKTLTGEVIVETKEDEL